MERLTFEGNFCDIAQCAETPGGSFCESGACSQRKVWERLKAYEDTGLEPEQCENAKVIIESAFSDDTSKAERIRELLKADKDGRLVVLPCKMGDRVYSTLDDLGRIHVCEAEYANISSRLHTNTVALKPLDYKGREYGAAFGAFGKTVFLTREEAEKALEAKQNG